MTNKNSNYNLSAASPSKKPGFVLFKSQEDGQYYFHFNSEEGEPFFFSQGSTSVSKRDKKIEAVKINAAISKMYKLEKEADQFFFTLRAGNFQEIGRSKLFPNKAEMKKMMDYFSEKAAEVKTSASPAVKEDLKKQASKEQVQQTDEQFALKYSYQVHLYPSKEEKLINGRIMNTRTERKGTFTGLDGQAIVDFMKEDLAGKMPSLFLSVAGEQPEILDKEKTPANLVPQRSQKKAEGFVLTDPSENLQVKIFNKNSGKTNNTLTSGMFYEVQLFPKENAKLSLPKTGEKIPFEISIKAIKGSNFSNIRTEQMEITSNGNLRLTSLQGFPYPGIYRMVAKSVEEKGGNSNLCGISVVNIL